MSVWQKALVLKYFPRSCHRRRRNCSQRAGRPLHTSRAISSVSVLVPILLRIVILPAVHVPSNLRLLFFNLIFTQT